MASVVVLVPGVASGRDSTITTTSNRRNGWAILQRSTIRDVLYTVRVLDKDSKEVLTELGDYYYEAGAVRLAKEQSRHFGRQYIGVVLTDGSNGKPRYRAFQMGRPYREPHQR